VSCAESFHPGFLTIYCTSKLAGIYKYEVPKQTYIMKIYNSDSKKYFSKLLKSNQYSGYAGCKLSYISQQIGNHSGKIANILILICGLLFFEFQVHAQRTAVVLNPDDKPAFAAAPEGFDIIREIFPMGKLIRLNIFQKPLEQT